MYLTLLKGLLKISVRRQNAHLNFLLKVWPLPDLELSTGPIRVANSFEREEKAAENFRDGQSFFKTFEQIRSF